MKTRKIAYLLALVALFPVSSAAMKNRQRTYRESCDSVWKSAVNVAKTQDYRIVSVSNQEQIISLSVGGVWSGERMVTLSIAPGAEGGCTATVQSRFSGLAHSDGPDLLSRIAVDLTGQTVDRDSKAFRRYKACLESTYTSDEKCEEHLRKSLAAEESKARASR